MRDFISAVLILGGLAAAAYAVWLVVERRSGKQRRKGALRARTLGIAGIIALLLGGAIAPTEQTADREDGAAGVQEARESTTTQTTATTATPETTATTPEENPAAVLARAEDAVDDDHYGEALAIVAVLGDAQKERIERKISRRLAARAVRALNRGDRKRASSLLRRAEDYPVTPQARRARSSLRAAQQRASARRAERRRQREQERQRRAAEREAREAEERAQEEAAEPSEPDTGSVPSGTCDEVGMTDFPVPPGDPRDRDGDGIACES